MNARTPTAPQDTPLQEALGRHVGPGAIPGLVARVVRNDTDEVVVLGSTHADGARPMRRDTIFRIASLTKPVAAAAAMMLIDDGRLRLEDSIEPWLPELANRRVLKRIDSPLDDTVPARRAITVRDVLTYTFGFGSVMAMPGTYPIQAPIAEGHLGGDGFPRPSLTPGTDEWMRRLGALPLMFQPGERWLYNAGGDLLGVLVARVCGRSFESFLRERLFEPLGMADTAFSVPAAKRDRLAGLYGFDHASGSVQAFDDEQHSEYGVPPAFESGAGGLVSTLDDYHAFLRLLLDGGAGPNGRVLSADAVREMTRDQLTPAQRSGAELFFGTHGSWGYGLGVDIRAGKLWQVPGRYGWDGGFGLSAYTDPSNRLIGILMTQRMMDSPQPPAVFEDFWAAAYRFAP